MLKLLDYLTALNRIGAAALTAFPDLQKVFAAAALVLKPTDQQTAQNALADLIADNDAGHKRLQQMLRDLQQ